MAEGKVVALIVDADAHTRAILRSWLLEEPGFDLIGECDLGAAALAAVCERPADLIIMSTSLPDADGFAVMQQLALDLPTSVILTGESDTDAARAFDVGAVDFLRRPLSRNRVRMALRRALDRIVGQRLSSSPPLAREAGRTIDDGAASTFRRKLLVKHRGRIVVIRVDTIRRIEAAANYQRIITTDREYLVRMSVAQAQASLDHRTFVRVHRSCIVNMDRVISFRHIGGGSYVVTQDDGSEIRMSRMFSSVVLSVLSSSA